MHSADLHALDDEDPPGPAAADAGDGEGDATGDELSFDAGDIQPATDDLGDSALGDELEHMQAEREEQRLREQQAREDLQKQMEEAGRQQRQNVRVNTKLPITVRVPGHPESETRTRDLSATGIGFATRLPLEREMRGTVVLHFADWDFSKEFVVRFVKPVIAGRQVGVQFDALTDDERERVVKEVFAVQRSQLQSQRLPGP